MTERSGSILTMTERSGSKVREEWINMYND
jgi:hypothetical protein